MPRIVKAAFAYTVPVFAFAFLVGAVRVMLVAPATGPVVAVALEIPLVLVLSWVIAGRLLQHWSLSPPERAAMGALAFALLMLAELLTALAFAQTPAQFLTAMTTPAGALGLAGQLGFALLPLLRQVRG